MVHPITAYTIEPSPTLCRHSYETMVHNNGYSHQFE